MKWIAGSVLLLCLSSLVQLAASEEILQPDHLASPRPQVLPAARPMFRSHAPLSAPVCADFDAWAISLQDAFFRDEVSQTAPPVSGYMADRAFHEDLAPRAAAAHANASGWLNHAPSLQLYRDLLLTPPSLTLPQPPSLQSLETQLPRRPDALPLIQTLERQQAKTEQALDQSVDRLRTWLNAPATARSVDAANLWLSNALAKDLPLPDPTTAANAGANTGLTAGSEAYTQAAANANREWARLADAANHVTLPFHLDTVLTNQLRGWINTNAGLPATLPVPLPGTLPDRLNTGASTAHTAASELVERLRTLLQNQSGRLDTDTLLNQLNGRLDRAQTLLHQTEARLAAGESTLLAQGQTAVNGATQIGLNALPPAGDRGAAALTQLVNGTGLPALQSLQLGAGRIDIAANQAAFEGIEFRFGSNRFSMGEAAWFSQANTVGGRDNFFELNNTDLSLASGDFARFGEFRLGVQSSSHALRVAGSIADLDVQFAHKRYRLDAGAFAFNSSAAGLNVQAILYPHDARQGGNSTTRGNRPGVYFAARSEDLAVVQQVQDLIDPVTGRPDIPALVALLQSRPRLFGNDYQVVFSGRAAKLLAGQSGAPLDGGTRLLIDAFSGFSNGTRTFAITGRQVDQISQRATAHRYSDVVEAARSVVPEIDILYSHYLRRMAGRPDSLARPVTLWREGDLAFDLGAASGDYATQWFAGFIWTLPWNRASNRHPVFTQKLAAGWLYEQAGLLDDLGESDGMVDAGPGAVFNPYNYERAGFLQYRANGWLVNLQSALHPTLPLDAARQLRFTAALDLGLRQADFLSFADQNDFARPKELLGNYNVTSPLGNVFPIFHAETTLEYQFTPPSYRNAASAARSASEAFAGGWRQQIGVGCDADVGYGGVARKLHLQLPIVPELTPKVFANFARPHHRIQLLAAWPTAADQTPFAAVQYSWDLNGR